jgi:rhamnose transport system substrate-binding protein
MKKLGFAMLMAFLALSMVAGQTAKNQSGKVVKVRYICLVKGIPYFDPIIEGMKRTVEAAGAIFQETAPDQSDATAQIPLIEAAAQEGVDVICLSPSSADALNATLDKARAKGIKVLCVNDDLVANETHRDGAVLSANYDQLGIDSFEAFAKLMKYKGDFVVLSSKTDTPFQNHQIDIFKQRLVKYKDLKLVEVLYGNDEATKSLTEAEAAIQKYPRLAGIMSPTSVGVIAAAQAVENSGLQNKLVVYGLGTPTQCKDFIMSGALTGAMLWDTARTGEVAGTLAVGMATGKIVLKAGSSFTAGKWGKTDILAKNILYAGPPLEFNKGNVDKYKF